MEAVSQNSSPNKYRSKVLVLEFDFDPENPNLEQCYAVLMHSNVCLSFAAKLLTTFT
jgi:hypothetical protein